MNDTKETKKRPRRRSTKPRRTNAVSVTIHSRNGAPVPDDVLNKCADAVTEMAWEHDLIVNVARG